MVWIDAAEDFVGARRLRNLLVHEYMDNAALFFEALLAADRATRLLFSIVARMREQARQIGLQHERHSRRDLASSRLTSTIGSQ